MVDTSYAERYSTWIARARSQLEAEQRSAAFSDYPYIANTEAPFTALSRPLAECTIVPITSGGLYLRESQELFDASNPEGDQSYQTLPTSLAQSAIAVAHDHYDPVDALADYNSVYPVDRLRELVAEQVIGEVAPVGYSFMGYITRGPFLLPLPVSSRSRSWHPTQTRHCWYPSDQSVTSPRDWSRGQLRNWAFQRSLCPISGVRRVVLSHRGCSSQASRPGRQLGRRATW